MVASYVESTTYRVPSFFTTVDLEETTRKIRFIRFCLRQCYVEAVRTAGDTFFNVPFTTSGTPYVQATELLRKIRTPETCYQQTPGATRLGSSTNPHHMSHVTTTHINHTIHA